jgi:hypothetical protein
MMSFKKLSSTLFPSGILRSCPHPRLFEPPPLQSGEGAGGEDTLASGLSPESHPVHPTCRPYGAF